MAEHGRNVVDGLQLSGNFSGRFKKQLALTGEAYAAVLPAEDGKTKFLLQILDAYNISSINITQKAFQMVCCC